MNARPATDLIDVVEESAADAERTPVALSDESGIAPARPRRSLRQIMGTLGARLVAGVVGLVIVVVASAAGATYFALDHYLRGRLVSQLDQTAGSPQISNALESGYMRGGRGPSVQSVWLLVLLADGSLYSQQATGAGSTIRLDLTEAQRSTALRHQDRHEIVRTTAGKELMIVAHAGCVGPPFACQASAGTPVVLIVGLATDEMRDTLHRVVVLEASIGVGAVLLALLLSAWGVGVGLGPLKRVTRTAQEVTAEMSSAGGGLDRRVPQSGNTTEVGQLATSFNTMLDKVEHEFTARRESEERMRQFLADASHELRTPLTSIRGYAELARLQRGRAAGGSADAGGQDSSSDDDSIGRIEAEGTRMSRLVEDLLLLARGDDAGAQTKRAPVDVGALAAQAVHDVQMAHPDRDITCSVAAGLIVSSDEDQLLRVLRNLIGNAAVHTDPASPIALTGSRRDASVVLQVRDGGPGLAPEEASHVFERFWRADKARTRVRGGSGLGMSIVAQIVAAHGGQVHFDSSVAQGSTVTVTLPAAPTSPWAAPTS